MKYKFFIGADIAKDTIQLAVKEGGQLLLQQQVENTKPGIRAFLQKIKAEFKAGGKNTLFCLEATGYYGKLFTGCLKSSKAVVWEENALQIKRSLGMQRGKSDKLDAERIAGYALLFQDNARPLQAKRKEILRLHLLNRLRQRLQRALIAFELPLKEYDGNLPKTLKNEVLWHQRESYQALKADLVKTEETMRAIIRDDSRLFHLFQLITSVPHVGEVLARELIIHTNEFLSFSAVKPFACYCGIAPFEHSSGTSLKGKARVSHFANKQMKTALFYPALGAIRRGCELHDYYKRKVAEGKPKLSVLNAVKNKLLQRVFCCVREDRPYVRSPFGKNHPLATA
jgi:transposase